MAPHSSTLAWKIPWMEEPGRLQSMGLLRVGHDSVTSLSLLTFMHWRRKRQPTPVFLPGESQGRRSLVGCHLWGRRVGHDWSDVAAAAAVAESRKQTCIMGWLRGTNNWCKISETRSAPHRSSPLSLSFRIYRTSSSSTSSCRASYDRLPQNHGTMITQRRAKIKSASLKQSLPFMSRFFFFKCAFFAIVNQRQISIWKNTIQGEREGGRIS